MATLYGKAAGGNFNGPNWSTTGSGGVDSVTPTAADNCILEAGSGNFTINAVSVCRSLDCTAGTGDYTGTLTGVLNVPLTIGDSIAGAGNVAIKFSSAMTYAVASNSAFTFISNAAAQQTVDFAGKTTLGNITFNGVSYLITANFSVLGGILHSAGTLNTNGQTIGITGAAGFRSSGVIARTLTLGSSAINMVSTSVGWDFSGSNLTITPNTATVTVSGASAPINLGGFDYNGMSMVLTSSGTNAVTGSATLANFTRTGTATKTDGMTLAGSITCTGTFTLTGNSTTNRLLVQSSVVGTSRTVTAATVTLTNVDFQDTIGAGLAAPFTGTSLGDAQGNSNIVFDSPLTLYRVGAGGNWSASQWALSSGGATGQRVPLPQDDVNVDAGVSGTVTLDMPRPGKSINFTGFSGTATTGLVVTLFGSFTLSGGMAWSGSGAHGINLAGRSNYTITSAGKTMPQGLQIIAPGGTYTLQDSWNAPAAQITSPIGTFVTANHALIVAAATWTGAAVVDLGTSTVTLSALANGGSGGVWVVVGTAVTLTASMATIVVGTVSTSARNFVGGGKSYGELRYIVPNSPGALIITGANTFNNLNVGSGRALTMPSSTVNTINSGGSFNVSGVNNGHLYLPGVAGNYASAPDSAALSIAGDLDLVAYCAADNWIPSATTTVLSKYETAGNQRSYTLNLTTTGFLQLIVSLDGTSTNFMASTVATGFSGGTGHWIRATLDASDGLGNFVCKFYTSNDPPATAVNAVAWTQLGATSTSPGTITIFDSTAAINIGSVASGSLQLFAGKIYRTVIRNGYDGAGSVVFDADFTTKPFGVNSFTESSVNAATMTINGALAQAGDGRVMLNSSVPGTPAILSKSSGTTSVDYLTIQDSTATGGAAWYAGVNSVNVSGNSGWIFGALGATATRASNFLPFFNA